MNRRPSGYEPDELPDCSIPRLKYYSYYYTYFDIDYYFFNWLREPDLNRRPSGYEPDELPDCSIPRPIAGTILRMRSDASFFDHFLHLFTKAVQINFNMFAFYPIARKTLLECLLSLIMFLAKNKGLNRENFLNLPCFFYSWL